MLVTFHSFLYLFFGWLFFGVTYQGSFLLAFMFLLLTTLVLASLGIMSASFAMVFKRGDPFALILGTGSAFFSGVFFPTQLLSEVAGSAVANISRLIPTTARTRRHPPRVDSGTRFRGSARSDDDITDVSRRPASLLPLGLQSRRAPRETRGQFDSVLICDFD